MSISGVFDITDEEAEGLGLGGKVMVNWWGLDCVPNRGRKGFYYVDLKHPLNLVQVHPPSMIVREGFRYDENKESGIRIEGLPSRGGIKLLEFSYYHLGISYELSQIRESMIGQESRVSGLNVSVAPITFLKLGNS